MKKTQNKNRTIRISNSQEDLAQIIQAAKTEWQCTVDSLGDLVFLLDSRKKIMRANLTLERWGVGKVNNVSGVEMHKLMHPNCRSTVCQLRNFCNQAWVNLLRGKESIAEIRDDVWGRNLKISFNPVVFKNASKQNKNGCSDIFAVAVLSDITRRKEAELRLSELYQYLGIINRKISILLSLGKNRDEDKKQNAIEYLVSSALEFSKAKMAMMYQYSIKEKCFNLVNFYASENLSKKQAVSMKIIDKTRTKALKKILKKGKHLGIDAVNNKFEFFDMKGKIKKFSVFNLQKRNNVRGLLVFGFDEMDVLSENEIDFLNIFSSQALLSADSLGAFRSDTKFRMIDK